MVCKRCGKDIPDNVLFCGYCGEKCEEKRGVVCKVCGAELAQNMQYCHVCGTRVDKSEENKKTNKEESDVVNENKIFKDERRMLILLIFTGICVGFVFIHLVRMVRNSFYLDGCMSGIVALMEIVFATFRISRVYNNKRIKRPDIVICVVLALFSMLMIGYELLRWRF